MCYWLTINYCIILLSLLYCYINRWNSCSSMCSIVSAGISQNVQMFNSRIVGLRWDFLQIQFPHRHWVVLTDQRNDIYWGPACPLCCCLRGRSGGPDSCRADVRTASPWLSSPWLSSSWGWYFPLPELAGPCPHQSLRQLLDFLLVSSCFYGSQELTWTWPGYRGCLHTFYFSSETQTSSAQVTLRVYPGGYRYHPH